MSSAYVNKTVNHFCNAVIGHVTEIHSKSKIQYKEENKLPPNAKIQEND